MSVAVMKPPVARKTGNIHLNNEVFCMGFALKHLVRDRDRYKPRKTTCWSSLKNVSDEPFYQVCIDFF